MTAKRKLVCIGFTALLLLIGTHFMFTLSTFAADADKAAAVKYDLDAAFEENLLLFKGKYVRITLNGGTVLSGQVKDVKKGLLHLEKISERDFFDALIKIENITAMEAKFRGF